MTYGIIMDLFSDCYRKWETPSSAQQLMPDAFKTLADTLPNDGRRKDFCRRLLLLFS